MSRRENEVVRCFPDATMREQQHVFSHPTSMSLSRRRSSLSSQSCSKEKSRTRSNSISSVVQSSCAVATRAIDSTKRRPSLVARPKESKDSSSTPVEQYSLVVLGVGGVGKTALVVRYVTGRFLHEYDPTLEMTYEKELHIADSTVSLAILDTAGNGEAAYIKQGDGFIIVYSITDYYSFEVARQLIKLIKEVRRTDDTCQVPIVLVGNKRDSRRGRCVSKNEAREVASENGCSHYETSALTNRNVQVVFYNMVFQARFTKASNRESRKSPGPNNGFLNSVKQLFNPAGRHSSRRASLPS